MSIKVIRNARGHFLTILRHKREVLRLCFAAGMYWQGITHDLSKFSVAEFKPGVRYYQDGKCSPTAGERADRGVSLAWLHHKGRNKHHFEYWMDISETRRLEGKRMPERYLAEMAFDRTAASKTYLKERYTNESPLLYLQDGNDKNYMHPDTCQGLYELLSILANDGEDAMISRVRQMLGK